MSPPTADRKELGTLLRSVVKVLTVSDAPDYEQPWQTQGPTNTVGSGAIVETSRGLRVLTNAHCVENHVFVELRRYGKARKFLAEVEAIGHECDLALLRMDDASFFQGTTPIPLGVLPQLSDQVSVCGYPIGGERLSITQGIVSRIELVQYAQSQRRLLAVQIDAAINTGNSGGPVLMDGKLVGVAFQSLDDADQIGYMIALPVIEHFLEDVQNGAYDGFPGLGAMTQPLESKAHRRYLGLPEDQDEGVLVFAVVHGGSASGAIKVGDVLLEIDGVSIESDGTVPLREGELIDYEYLVSRRHVGESITVRLWRAGAEVRETIQLKEPQYLVPEDRYDVPPSYYIVGGLVFAQLSRDYLKTWPDPWNESAPSELMTLYEKGIKTSARHEIVLLQKVLADVVNQGYHDHESMVLRSAQGQNVRSLAHLVQIVEATDEEFLRFGFVDGRRVVIERALAMKRHPAILKRFGVPRDRSADLPRATEQTTEIREIA